MNIEQLLIAENNTNQHLFVEFKKMKVNLNLLEKSIKESINLNS